MEYVTLVIFIAGFWLGIRHRNRNIARNEPIKVLRFPEIDYTDQDHDPQIQDNRLAKGMPFKKQRHSR